MAVAAAALMIPTAVAIVFLLLSPTGCIALISSNDTSNTIKHLVGDKDLDSEFLMESHLSRILASNSQNFQTSSTNNANRAAVDCSRQPRYDSCLGQKNGVPPPENCATYNRVCPT
ncbi:uncharacterized protein LOC111013208 [Momordica charantia]|uniref:Uncharacterized protein LOC111013208 n=1 Tax=Momordica charantia TaxID=3673 RepID=A0A6J1CNY1_MOMCH|nr:uncharacterized protein LOC111013208 [Momordica charantia]